MLFPCCFRSLLNAFGAAAAKRIRRGSLVPVVIRLQLDCNRASLLLGLNPRPSVQLMASLQAGGDTPAAPFVTPTKRAAFTSTTQAGPSRASPQGASPAYVSQTAACCLNPFISRLTKPHSIELSTALSIWHRGSYSNRVSSACTPEEVNAKMLLVPGLGYGKSASPAKQSLEPFSGLKRTNRPCLNPTTRFPSLTRAKRERRPWARCGIWTSESWIERMATRPRQID